MGIIPNTGSEIQMGRVQKAFTNVVPGAGSNLYLTQTLGAHIGHTAFTTLGLSTGFGGRTTPYTY